MCFVVLVMTTLAVLVGEIGDDPNPDDEKNDPNCKFHFGPFSIDCQKDLTNSINSFAIGSNTPATSPSCSFS